MAPALSREGRVFIGLLSFNPTEVLTTLDSWPGTFLWNASRSFFNTSWIYGQVQNFGGRPGVYGRLDAAAYDFPKAFAEAGSLEGLGTFSEALEQNPVAVDLLMAQVKHRRLQASLLWVA